MAGYIGTKAVALSTTTGNILGDMTVGGTTDVATLEFNSLSGTGSVTITDILDEDNLASNSATKLATQQSIKAYVDSQVDTVDTLAEILAIGNRTSGTGKIEFRDAAIFINSSTDGQLDLVADTELELTAPTIQLVASTKVDLDGNLDVSGTALVTGKLTTTGELAVSGQGTVAVFEATDGPSFISLKDDDGTTAFLGCDAGSLVVQTSGSSFSTKLSINAAGAATFNSEAAAPSFKATDFIDIRNDDAELYFTNAANNRYARFRRDNTHNDIDMSFFNGSSTTNKFKFRASGDLQVLSGNLVIATDGKGINFAGPTAQSGATSQTLDSYEEGTHNVVSATGGGGAGTNSAPLKTSYDMIRYTKIGNMVTIQGQVQFGNVSSPSGGVTLSLPFSMDTTNAEGSNVGGGVVRTFNGNAASGGLYLWGVTVFNTGDKVTPEWVVSGGTTVSHVPSSNEFLILSFSYMTA